MRIQHGILSAVLAVSMTVTPVKTADAARVNWSPDIESALRSANQSGRMVLMKFTADWCGYCKKMENETFTQAAVAQLVNQRFVPVLVDADKHQDLVQHLQIKGLPALLVVSPEMVILTRISGYQTAEKLIPKLQDVLARQSRSQVPQAQVAGSSGFTPGPTRPVSSQSIPQTALTQQTAQAPPVKTVFAKPAFGGLCLPAVNETRSLVSGRPQFTTTYRGKTLYFSSQEHLQKFLAAPGKYWPAHDGTCPVTVAETGKAVEGNLEYAAMFRGKLWVMTSAAAMQNFVKQPATYVDALLKP